MSDFDLLAATERMYDRYLSTPRWRVWRRWVYRRNWLFMAQTLTEEVLAVYMRQRST